MNTKEAIQAMLEGKKVKKDTFHDGVYMSFDGDCFRGSDGSPYTYFLSASDWEIYEEPTQKKTALMEKWLCETAWGDFIAIEASVGHFQTTKYRQVRLLEAYEVVL